MNISDNVMGDSPQELLSMQHTKNDQVNAKKRPLTQAWAWSDLRVHHAKVWNVVRSPNLLLLATTGQEEDKTDTVKLWSTSTTLTSSLPTLRHTLVGHERAIVALAFSPDNLLLLSGSDDATIRIWQVESGQCIGMFAGHTDFIRDVRFHPTDATLVASCGWDATVRMWRIEQGSKLHLDVSPMSMMNFGQDAALAALLPPNMQQADQASSSLSSSSSRPLSFGCREILTLRGHEGWVWNVAFSPDGSRLASVARDHHLRIWDVVTGACLANVATGHEGSVFACPWSPDGTLLATSSSDGKIKIFDTTQYECTKTFEGHTGWVWRLEWSEDGRRLASAAMEPDKSVRLWDMSSGESMVVASYSDSASAAHFVGSVMLTACLDGMVRLHQL